MKWSVIFEPQNLALYGELSSTTPTVTSLDAEWERVVIAEPCDPAAPASFGRVEVMMPTL